MSDSLQVTSQIPLVSVVCISYNHEKYINQALESILAQKTAFPFEIIAADDCSTDGTQSIIQQLADEHPNIIVPVLRPKNLGINNNYYDAVQRVRGEFIAICDGDDYWIDDNKL